MILVDANVLLRLIQIGHPHQQPALDSIALLHTRDHEQFVSCPQVLYGANKGSDTKSFRCLTPYRRSSCQAGY